ncbi:S-methyl-5-thioribose kinase [Proteiniclasticum sp. C24MP]|uniref:S-methyl-5-thioribose kinase n=1 Tax=Proteiniclasticum sp. C24MP TaxID=3374101 RepID=UPI0037544443
MNKYNEHFLLDTESVKDYVVSKLNYFKPEENIDAQEIGDGNINYVFKVWNPLTGKSIIVKQADKLLRSSGRPLDMYRNRIEAEILKIQRNLAPEYVPEIYFYDENMYVLAMEDISEFKNMRTEMLNGKIFAHFSDNVSTFLADTLIPTTDLFISRSEKKNNVKKFMNPELCDISEDLVFTEPYWDYKKRNIILKENLDFVKENLYDDKVLHFEVAKLRDRFMNYPQALIHGDLHSGSIFANDSGIKIIDPEFAFYGPIGYDSGNVIGNLCMSWVNKEFTDASNQHFIDWIKASILDIMIKLESKITTKLKESTENGLYKYSFKQFYTNSIIEDTYGYAGTEIIRRVVGDSKVKEVTSVEDPVTRIPMERAMIKVGIYLIKNRYNSIDLNDLQKIINVEK